MGRVWVRVRGHGMVQLPYIPVPKNVGIPQDTAIPIPCFFSISLQA